MSGPAGSLPECEFCPISQMKGQGSLIWNQFRTPETPLSAGGPIQTSCTSWRNPGPQIRPPSAWPVPGLPL